MEDAGKQIRKLREALRLSQEGLAKRLGVSFTTVNRWETGKTYPTATAIRKLKRCARRRNCGLADLRLKPRVKGYSAFAFFAGAGGFHLGFSCPEIEVLLATDLAESAELTHKANWPSLPFLRKDIRLINASELLKMAGGRRPDIVFGGPPCQGFSTLGDKLSADPKNQLFDAYARLVADLSPQCVVIENVKSMTTMYGGQYADHVVGAFERIGYRVYTKVLDTSDYGVPQIRERVIFFATKCPNPFAFPRATHGNRSGLKPIEVVGDWIMDLADKGSEVANHIVLEHSETVVARYKLIPEGGRLPAPELLPADIRRKNFGNTYKRLARQRPSLTMVPGNNAFPIHPTLDRSLTPREAARIQTFPDTHIFAGNRREQCILVGNAVPPLFAKALREAVLSHLNGLTPPETAASVAPRLLPYVSALPEASKSECGIPVGRLNTRPISQGFVDLFSGAGGFTLGFAKAAWRPLLSVDLNKYVEQTHKIALPSVPFLNGDLANDATRSAIADSLKGETPAILVGGPPCQGFSIFGKRRFVNTKGYDPHRDPRNKLVYAFLDLVQRLKPRWFVMENVKGFASLDEGLFLQSLLEEFRRIGYANAEARILNAADYGVPQLRERLLIIGNTSGHIIPWPKRKYFESPEEWQRPYRTVAEAISDLADPSSFARVSCHVPMNHKPLLVERYRYIPEGGKLNVDALPPRLRVGYRTEEVKNYSHIFKRLHRDRPAFTMVPGHNAFPIHPWLDRALTVREAARIQTFPDCLEFQGPRQEQCIQVGNAFPPLLAELIAGNIRKAETNGWYPDRVPASAFYALVEREPSTDTAQVAEATS